MQRSKTAVTFVSVVVLAGATASSAMAAKPTAQPPVNLRCEYRSNPLGTDVRAPRLSWQVHDARRGAVQTAYQIVVSTDSTFADPQAVVWDTGKVASDQSVHVVYAGKPLASGQRYAWKVRTWDADGKPTDYAQPAFWEMGLLSPTDWQAKWITSPSVAASPTKPDLAAANWIWNAKAEGNKKSAFFRCTFDIDAAAKVEHAEASASTDNSFTLFVNGTEVRSSENFHEIQQVDITDAIKPGQNLLAVKCWNEDGPAGLILAARIKLADGKIINLASDGTWKSSPAETADWTQQAADDSAWTPAKVIGKYGCAPWGELASKSRPRPSTLMRHDFTAKAKPVQARVYVTGLGTYRLFINGQRVGEDLLSPGWTDYHRRVQYQTYDVTNLVKDGSNAVGAILGNAWWSGGVGWSPADFYSKGNLRLLVQLVVQYADGSTQTITTGPGWKTHASPITRDALYHGETYDARLELPGWAEAGFDAKGWSDVEVLPGLENNAALVADRCDPIRITQELPAVWVSEPVPHEYIFDFGQNAAGYARLKVKAPAGTTIRLRFGEELDPGGRLYRDNYRSAEATDYYTCKGTGEETWEPMFTYRGFRYCEVTGYPGRPADDALTFCVLHSAVPPTGVFECSQPILNQIYKAIAWGQRSNLHSIPSDCPQRNERLGWTGDANVFGATSCWNMDMAAFWTKWMRDVADSQSPEGWVTDVAPAQINPGPAAPGWGDACVVTPWNIYQFYGDTRIIEDYYDTMVGWIEYMQNHREPGNGLYEREGFGDWVAIVPSPKKPIGAAYHYYATKLVADMAAAIGRNDDAEKYHKRADEIARRFNDAYLDTQTNNYPDGTQTANLLPLFFGITPAERRAAVARNIGEDIRKRGYHLSTGFLGTVCLMPTLADTDQQETAYKVAVQTTCPSWAYMFAKGATTIWERWDTDKWGPDMNSRNHYAFGAVGQWLYEAVAGIRIDPARPGFKHIIIKPQPAGDLSWAGATFASMYGDVHVDWRRTPEGLELHAIVPANTTADVHVPTLGSRNPTVTVDDMQIAGGKARGRAAGVDYAGSRDGYVTFKVAAGEYTFRLNGN